VTNYLSRPELKIRERRGPLNSYTYSKAIQKFPQHLSLEFLRDLYLFAKTNLPEREVMERFLVLTPDLFDVPPTQPSHPDLEPMAVDEAPTTGAPVSLVSSPPVSLATAPSSQTIAQAVSTSAPTATINAILPPSILVLPPTSLPPPTFAAVAATSTSSSQPTLASTPPSNHSLGALGQVQATPFEIANLLEAYFHSILSLTKRLFKISFLDSQFGL
jgi:hypothetical protein